MKTRSITPLFIPLKAKFFEQFKAGTKTSEYRLRGPRWNAETCCTHENAKCAKHYTQAEDAPLATGAQSRRSQH